MKALVFERNLARYGASRVASTLAGSGHGVKVGPLRLTEIPEPDLPGPGWRRLTTRLAGVCGSDLATLDGTSSRFFEDIVSFPFVPGHEIVADIVAESGSGPSQNTQARAEGPLPGGSRVVVEPVLTCAARAVTPLCDACGRGDTGCCISIASGHISPGLQTGYCADTGGGWGRALVAHDSQLHPVPDSFSDEDAVMVEPAACGVHAALRARAQNTDVVAIIGAGTLGLLTLASLKRWASPRTVVVAAKHPVQRQWAGDLGADVVVEPDALLRAVRRATGTLGVGPVPATLGRSSGVGRRSSGSTEARGPRRLAGGADVVVDCVGNAESVATALALVRPRGRVVLVGMPGPVRVDLAPLWQREVVLTSAYAYGAENPAWPGAGACGAENPPPPAGGGTEQVRTFALAFELVADLRLGRLVSAVYPLERAREAVAHAADAGPRGAVKIAFDPRRK